MPSKEEPNELAESDLTYLVDEFILPEYNKEPVNKIQELKKKDIISGCGGLIKGFILIYTLVKRSESNLQCAANQRLYIKNLGESMVNDEVDVNFFGSVKSVDANKGIFIMNYVVGEYIGTRIKGDNGFYLYHLVELRDKKISRFIKDWTKYIKNTIIVNIILNDEESEKAFEDNSRVKELCRYFGIVKEVKGLQCQMTTFIDDYTDKHEDNAYSNFQLNVRVYFGEAKGEINDDISLTFETMNEEELSNSKDKEEEKFYAYYTKEPTIKNKNKSF
jgi:hypothetical protein